jgi:hypothetical protein
MMFLETISLFFFAVGELEPLARGVQSTIQSGITDSTRQQYGPCWKKFTDFCSLYGLVSLPASYSTVLLYLEALKRKSGCFSPLVRRKRSI